MAQPRPWIATSTALPTGPKGDGSVEVIDRYQLVARLGKGGMAEVFRAKLQSIGGFERDVALKVLLPSFAAEPEFVEMLLDEARIAGAIDHPNVLQVLDVGRKDEIFYLVMEYVDGKDLRTIAKGIPGGRIPLGMALYVISEMLRGLHAVHTAVDERGLPRRIVHRDISPGNVMVDRRGFVKLGDFGIAHASGRITRTRVGAVKGKSRYMAPEQLGATAIDHRADLYAVGVTLFEAILGDFARQSSRPTLYGPMFTWPERIPEGALPPDVEAILRRAITEAPSERYRDALAFREDLELALYRWAPGYGPDTLCRELARLLPGGATPPSVHASIDATARGEAGGVSVRPVRWRGVPTAEHAASPRPSIPSRPSLPSVPAVRTNGSIVPAAAGFDDEAFPGEPERTLPEANGIPPEITVRPRETGSRPNRRVGVSLVVAVLALVTVAIAAVVAGSGTAAPLPELSAPTAISPTPIALIPSLPAATVSVQRLQPPPAPPLSTGAIEIRRPVGAGVRIGNIVYASAPTRVELPPGDYQLKLRIGKKRRLVTQQVHVVAGRTTSIP